MPASRLALSLTLSLTLALLTTPPQVRPLAPELQTALAPAPAAPTCERTPRGVGADTDIVVTDAPVDVDSNGRKRLPDQARVLSVAREMIMLLIGDTVQFNSDMLAAAAS